MPESLKEVFGRNLRSQRERIGLTQVEVAREVGLAGEAYGRLERGHVLPRTETLVAIAKVLGVSTDALLGVESSTRASLADEVGQPKAGYRVAASAELQRLITRLGKMRKSEIQLFSRLAGLVATNQSRRKR